MAVDDELDARAPTVDLGLATPPPPTTPPPVTTIDSFLRRIAATPVPVIDGPVIEPDRYVERVEIARGGMGRIIAARDRRLARPVAIKELRSPTPGLRARFARETRLTARLQHPSIVGVLEAGQWPSGEPFFAMRLVPGRSLDQVVADAKTLHARLALVPHVQAVADALAYAHREGVIHRDLKPHNVLVGEFGETVVIDWGLAKDLRAAEPDEPAAETRERDGDDAAATTAGDVMGTPAYMPPEQAAGDAVDERADVYAIGALLYHVLAGAPPYSGGSTTEVLAGVKRGAPTSLAAREPGLPPDLVAIVERAMARDPAARYAEAGALAADLRRFLAGQLVGAHAYSTTELLGRWLRRHRGAVVVGTIALVAATAVGVVSLRRVLAAEREATVERRAAVTHRADAEELMDFMLGDLRDKLEPVGKVSLLDTVAKKARDYYLSREVHAAADLVRRAEARSNYGDALSDQGHDADALVEHRAARVDYDAALAQKPTDAEWIRLAAINDYRIADILRRQGAVTDARAELNACLARLAPAVARTPTAALRHWQALAHGRLAEIATGEHDFDAALVEARAAEAISSAIAAETPTDGARLEVAHAHDTVGRLLRARKDLAGALASFRAALEIQEEIAARTPDDYNTQFSVALCRESIALTLRDANDLEGTAAEAERAAAAFERLTAREPANRVWLGELAVVYLIRGKTLEGLAKPADALRDYEAARAIGERLVALQPDDDSALNNLRISHQRIASLVSSEPSRAVAEMRAAHAIAEKLLARDPSSVENRLLNAGSYSWLGETLCRAKETREGLEAMREAVRRTEALRSPARDDLEVEIDLADDHVVLADCLVSSGDRAAALVEYDAAIAVLAPIATAHTDLTEVTTELERLRALVAKLRRR